VRDIWRGQRISIVRGIVGAGGDSGGGVSVSGPRSRRPDVAEATRCSSEEAPSGGPEFAQLTTTRGGFIGGSGPAACSLR